MRKLSILRTKSFVASAMKMTVYIEDQEYGDVVINGVPCQLLGVLPNGEVGEFYISTIAARVFVIADKLSKSYCYDYYSLPEGEEDIYLSGKNKFNPLAGNPFRFDGVEDPEVLESRKQADKKGLIVMIAAVAAGILLGLGIFFLATGLGGGKQEFTADGLSITLTKDYEEIPGTGFALCCEGPEAAMFALKEEFSIMAGLENYSVEQYAETVLQNNPLAAGASLQTEGNLNWFEYSYQNSEEEEPYRFRIYVFKSDDAFWMVQFAAPESNAEENAQKFEKWASTVSFADDN